MSNDFTEIDAAIDALTPDEKGQALCELNVFVWPEKLAKFKPDDFQSGYTHQTERNNVQTHAFDKLMAAVGFQGFTAAWWKHQNLGTKEEHDAYFARNSR